MKSPIILCLRYIKITCLARNLSETIDNTNNTILRQSGDNSDLSLSGDDVNENKVSQDIPYFLDQHDNALHKII
jgi:hypothetical protein